MPSGLGRGGPLVYSGATVAPQPRILHAAAVVSCWQSFGHVGGRQSRHAHSHAMLIPTPCSSQGEPAVLVDPATGHGAGMRGVATPAFDVLMQATPTHGWSL